MVNKTNTALTLKREENMQNKNITKKKKTLIKVYTLAYKLILF